jgi:hypothetical protein
VDSTLAAQLLLLQAAALVTCLDLLQPLLPQHQLVEALLLEQPQQQVRQLQVGASLGAIRCNWCEILNFLFALRSSEVPNIRFTLTNALD